LSAVPVVHNGDLGRNWRVAGVLASWASIRVALRHCGEARAAQGSAEHDKIEQTRGARRGIREGEPVMGSG